MNTHFILKAIGNINMDYLADAEEAMNTRSNTVAPTAKHRTWQRIALAAACLALLIAMIPIGVMIGKHINPDTPVTQPPAVRPSISDIPGAVPFENDGSFLIDETEKASQKIIDGRKWADVIKTSQPATFGTVSNHSSVIIENEDSVYHIVTMTIDITEIICNMENVKTVTAIYTCQYSRDFLGYYRISTPYIPIKGYPCYADLGQYAIDNQSGLFILEPVEDRKLSVEGETYNLSDYADYYMTAHLRYEPIEGLCGIYTFGGFRIEFLRDDQGDSQSEPQ